MGDQPSAPLEEQLQLLDLKVKQLKLDYEKYFLGTRPREPIQLRQEINKQVLIFSNTHIGNTAARFKFNSINSRLQAQKRMWDNNLRQIEAGTYKRHVFKADLHERTRSEAPAAAKASAPGKADAAPDLFESYREAAGSCGQSLGNLTREKLAAVVKKQEAALRQKLGCEKVNFRVVVRDGKVKLKASPVRGG
ncbi:MAG: MXAN_5187 C-terminal domain-containing protein [Myxococcota bacterium]